MTDMTPEQLEAYRSHEGPWIANIGYTVEGVVEREPEPGLEHRYDVYRRRGRIDGQQVLEPVHDCFVLRPETDPLAYRALRVYANAACDDPKLVQLGDDLLSWLDDIAERKPEFVS